jgi:hypothetical protein
LVDGEILYAEELHREGVGAFVFGVAGVALDPFEADFVSLAEGEEGVPEVGVENGFAAGAVPAFALPGVGPALGHGLDEVLGVAVDGDVTGFFEGLEGLDDGEDFHAVAGGAAEAAGEFPAVRAVEEDDAVAAGAGVGFGGAVGVEGDVLFGLVGHGLFAGTVLAEKLGKVGEAFGSGEAERGVTVGGAGVDVGLVVEKDFGDCFLTPGGGLVKRSGAAVVTGIDVGLVGQEQRGHGGTAFEGGPMEGSPAGVIPGVDVGVVGQEKGGDAFVALGRGEAQGRVAVIVAGIHVGVSGEEPFRHVLVANGGSVVEEGVAGVVGADQNGGMFVGDFLDHIEVAFECRGMSPGAVIAAGEREEGGHEGHGQEEANDGGETMQPEKTRQAFHKGSRGGHVKEPRAAVAASGILHRSGLNTMSRERDCRIIGRQVTAGLLLHIGMAAILSVYRDGWRNERGAR